MLVRRFGFRLRVAHRRATHRLAHLFSPSDPCARCPSGQVPASSFVSRDHPTGTRRYAASLKVPVALIFWAVFYVANRPTTACTKLLPDIRRFHFGPILGIPPQRTQEEYIARNNTSQAALSGFTATVPKAIVERSPQLGGRSTWASRPMSRRAGRASRSRRCGWRKSGGPSQPYRAAFLHRGPTRAL